MGQVVFLNTGHVPSQDEREHFYHLQAVTNNYKRDVITQEKGNSWAVNIRLNLMVQQRRSKIKLVENGEREI